MMHFERWNESSAPVSVSPYYSVERWTSRAVKYPPINPRERFCRVEISSPKRRILKLMHVKASSSLEIFAGRAAIDDLNQAQRLFAQIAFSGVLFQRMKFVIDATI
jgi:hypothetical protein